MGKHEKLTGAERVAKRRAAMRAQGLRPRQFWLPDPRESNVAQQIAHDVAAINASAQEAEDMAWIADISAETLGSLPDYDWGEGSLPMTTATKDPKPAQE